MKNLKATFIFSLIVSCISMVGSLKGQESFPEYSFKFKIKGLKDTVAYLGFHMGEKKYVRDTCRVNSKGEVEFTHLTRQGAKEVLKGGIYLFSRASNASMRWISWSLAVTIGRSCSRMTDSVNSVGFTMSCFLGCFLLRDLLAMANSSAA